MDHLELPRNPTHQPIPVRYFCTTEYDGGPFSTYPQRQGWTEADIYFRPNWTHAPPFEGDTHLTDGRRSAGEAASFLQNWLFFGLLGAVFGPQFHLLDFLDETDAGGHVVTTEKLFEYVFHLMERLNGCSPDALRLMMSSIDQDLTKAHQVFTFICTNTTLDPALILSIAIIGDSLTLVRNIVFWKGQPPSGELVFSWPTGDVARDILSHQMKADGWCVSQVIRSKRLTPSARYFVSRLEVPSAEKPHDACSHFRCIAYQMDWNTYETNHIQDACDCEFIAASRDRLVEILSKDKIPLISTTDLIANDFRKEIPIVESSRDVQYVAISHVWSDRMGNRHANALPQCQLRHLVRLIQALYPSDEIPVPFWIDTISCPVTPKSARNRAIILMRQTYRNADKVLVLDNYMRKHQALNVPVFEPFARIYHSGWTQRLWTLQEGVLAKSLFVQFADVAINFTESWDTMVRGQRQQTEFHNLLSFPLRIRGDWSLWGTTPFSCIQSVVIAFHERFTSVSTDEPLCLGSMLGIDMERLLEALPDQRMKRFWSLLPEYTGELAFWTGPRLPDEGFGWAPASFLNARLESIPGSSLSNAQNPAYLRNTGLEVVFPGFVLGTVKEKKIARKFWLRNGAKKSRYWLSCTAERELSADDISLELPDDASTATQIAVITRSPLRFDESASVTMQENEEIEAVLVKILERVNELIHVKIIKTAKVYSASPGSIPPHDLEHAVLHMQLMSQLDQGNSIPQIVVTPTGYFYEGDLYHTDVQELLSPKQRWCLV